MTKIKTCKMFEKFLVLFPNCLLFIFKVLDGNIHFFLLRSSSSYNGQMHLLQKTFKFWLPCSLRQKGVMFEITI